jgi:polyisoprenoid-binding protein YceI
MTTATISKPTDPFSMLATRWEIDPAHTTVEFAVKHMMISTVKGRFASVSGHAYVNPAEPSRPELEVTIDAASVDTGEANRDAHLRSPDFLDVDTYPHITFRARRIEGDLRKNFELVGDLTIHGVTRQVKLNAAFEGQTTDPWGGERVGFSATGKLNRKDFDLRWNVALEAGGWLVGDEVKLLIDAELVKSGIGNRES